MPVVVIEVVNLSKQYRLGTVGTGTISHDLNRIWARVTGKEDPALKIGEVNDRSTTGSSDYVWSLKDINFEVNRGEVLGIIGKNGAGKSTLLKILSKVTGPTTGSIRAKGRIGSLLEVGTGFHPELTGRENVFLNGAILGMKKFEIASKLDEIIDFSGCTRYIDTPVKRYSSGMKVRLAFAVAAFLQSEILIVDEVLAVGDDEFQKKAIGKMQDVSQGEGRTVLFVSHNMTSVRRLCESAIVLENGKIKMIAEVNEAVDHYLNSTRDRSNSSYIDLLSHKRRRQDRPTYFKSVRIFEGNTETYQIKVGKKLKFHFEFETKAILSRKFLRITFENSNGQRITTVSNKYSNDYLFSNLENGELLSCEIPFFNFLPGEYYVSIFLTDEKEIGDAIDNAFTINVVPDLVTFSGDLPHKGEGLTFMPSNWNLIKANE
jgi:homopolymeric O-antigen transport system ATP-binding protein